LPDQRRLLVASNAADGDRSTEMGGAGDTERTGAVTYLWQHRSRNPEHRE
jgi:hypothetical protein